MAEPDPLAKALDLVRRKSGSGGPAGRLAKQLEPLLQQLDKERIQRATRRGTGKIEYIVERTQQGEVLTERRLSGKSKPFRCPKAIYEAVADVLATADRPLFLDEIVSEVEGRMRFRPPEFQVRVPLRLWLHVEPPLLLRSRSRYSAHDFASFRAAALHLWNRL